MFKLLFLPRGYLTIIALFWSYEAGLLDSLLQEPSKLSATPFMEWLKAEKGVETDSDSNAEKTSSAELKVLKHEILAELSLVDQRTSTNPPSTPSAESPGSPEVPVPRRGEQRSEVPGDIQDFLHKIFR